MFGTFSPRPQSPEKEEGLEMELMIYRVYVHKNKKKVRFKSLWVGEHVGGLREWHPGGH